jgi:hypothetical protein
MTQPYLITNLDPPAIQSTRGKTRVKSPLSFFLKFFNQNNIILILKKKN